MLLLSIYSIYASLFIHLQLIDCVRWHKVATDAEVRRKGTSQRVATHTLLLIQLIAVLYL